jgi:hypothetical protein
MISIMILMAVTSFPLISKQIAPDQKRQTQIREALIAHGYVSGRTWPETVVILKKIAHEHHWQSYRAPDARVLLLLGLGSKISDPSILNDSPSKLEPGLLMMYGKGTTTK